MKFLFFFLIVFIIGCNGVLEKPIKKTGKGEMALVNNNFEHEIDLGGFKLTGSYGTKECPGKIYRKDFIESHMYVFEDCKSNRVVQIVRK